MIVMYSSLNFTNLQVLLLKTTKELNNTDSQWDNAVLDNVKAIVLYCVMYLFFLYGSQKIAFLSGLFWILFQPELSSLSFKQDGRLSVEELHAVRLI